MKKIFLSLLVSVFAAGALNAQNNATFSYSMGFATGDLADFINQPSFRGFSFDYRKLVTPNVGVGFNLGWNVFYDAPDKDSYTYGNSTLSGKQYRYSNHVPMLASGSYYFSPGESFNPFVSLGIGTIYTRRNTDMNLYTVEQEAWNFALQPEVGFNYELNSEAALTVSGKFNQGFKAGSELTSAQSFFTLNLGFTFINQ
jgi:outer membrane protein W